jgi:hypothetical protein
MHAHFQKLICILPLLEFFACHIATWRCTPCIVEFVACDFFAIAEKFTDKRIFKPFKIIFHNLKKCFQFVLLVYLILFFSSGSFFFLFSFPYFLLSSFFFSQIILEWRGQMLSLCPLFTGGHDHCSSKG